MYAVKEAQITREHLPSVREIDIYYMDMRAYGKDFDRYVENGKKKYGINFIRSRVGGVTQGEDGRLLLKSCAPDGTQTENLYDLVVLSTGFKPREENVEFFRQTGIRTDRYGFIACDPFSAPATSMEGIFACGAASGPKDIPETVTEASAAASGAAILANRVEADAADYAAYFEEETMVEPRDVSREPVRMGVFVCRCGLNIGGYVDVPEVCDYVRGLPNVVHVEDSLYTCSVDAQKNMMELIDKHDLNRVVVASCTPRTHEPLFQNVLKKTGLNPYLFNMSNIRDQCSWVHMGDKEAATAKAKELVRMAVGKGINSIALTGKKISVEPSVLVLGGGMSGISAALAAAEMGFAAYLVERTGQLGGNARHLNALYNGRPVSSHVQQAVDAAMNHPKISVYLNTEVGEIDGYVGNFETKLKRGEESISLRHGAVIVATGAVERSPEEYLYGKDERVVTQLQLDQLLSKDDERLKTLRHVVMIQCVGSREEGRMYCSRVCCNQALRNAAALRRKNPEIAVTILYRDIRSYGMYEEDYRDARQNGVAFVHYDPERKPVAKGGKNLKVTAYDETTGGEITLPADLLVLASAIVPEIKGSTAIAQMLKIPLTQDGFFLEAHAKLRPVDFATEGVYVCGLAHSPRNLKESIVQGRAAAGRAATVLSMESLETAGTIARVDPLLCTACGTCEIVCPFNAIAVQDVPVRGGTVRRAVVNDALCKGCGTCSANCRCGAVDLGGFTDRQIVTELEFLLRRQEVHG
jgi:heterodisulfide reductase subunit A